VPDVEGEQYDREMARIRARREAEDRGLQSPLDVAADALHDFQNGPKIARPSVAETFIPVVGPAWEAAADLQDGNYAGAAFNGAMAVVDVLPAGALVKGARAAKKGVGILRDGSLTSGATLRAYRKKGMAKAGEEVHHTIPLNGVPRNVADWRNHYLFLKSLPQETHRRIHGSWNGKPRFDPVRRMWYGTTDWMKTGAGAVTGYAVDGVQNLVSPANNRGPSAATKR
jgi:hypothetical protein